MGSQLEVVTMASSSGTGSWEVGIGKGRTVGSQLEVVTMAGDDVARRVLLYSVGVMQREVSKELG